MKIIEYTLGLPPYRRGGLPRYSLDLSLQLSNNNKVYLMYPGSINPFSKKIKVEFRNMDYPFQVVELKNMLPVSLGLGIDNNHIQKFYESRDISKLVNLINQINPDVVHFHTLMGIPKELIEYLHKRGTKLVFTTHDFYGLCPKMLVNNPIKELERYTCTDDCMLCNFGPSYSKLIVMQTHGYQKFKESKLIKHLRTLNKRKLNNSNSENKKYFFSKNMLQNRLRLRNYYLDMYKRIDTFHFNSSVSQKYFSLFFDSIKGEIIPITHSGLSDKRSIRSYKQHNRLKIGYIGPYDHKKGFFRMVAISKRVSDISIDFYGDVADSKLFQNPNITNHGVVSSDELISAYNQMDVLVVPSIWHETFGFVVLEALLQGTPCLVSSNVGAKDLVPEWCVFNTDEELITKLTELKQPKKLLGLSKEICSLDLPFNMKKHSKEIEKLYGR